MEGSCVEAPNEISGEVSRQSRPTRCAVRLRKLTSAGRVVNLDKLLVERADSSIGQVLSQDVNRQDGQMVILEGPQPGDVDRSRALVLLRELHDLGEVHRDGGVGLGGGRLDEGTLPAFGLGTLVLVVSDDRGLYRGLESVEKVGGREGATGDDEGEVVGEVGSTVVVSDC